MSTGVAIDGMLRDRPAVGGRGRLVMSGGRRWLAVVLAGLIFAPPFATISEAAPTVREDDITLTADWDWAGGSQGGYYPVRLSLTNAGPPRAIEVALKSSESGLPNVSRRMTLDQNASASISLLVPLVGTGSSAELRTYADGRELESLRTHVTLPNPGGDDHPFSALVISDSPVALNEFETAIASVMGTAVHTGVGSHRSDVEQVQPIRLPDTWLAYSGLDMVVTSAETLGKLDSLQRKAILDWALTGGCVAVFSDKLQGDELRNTIDDLTKSQPSAAASWNPVSQQFRRPIDRVQVDDHEINGPSRPGNAEDFKWPDTQEFLQLRKYGQGMIASLPSQPFDGTYQDWAWLLYGIEFRQQILPKRLGVSGRSKNEDFLAFLIPGVRSVPVIAFAVAMSLFAILIGPVNYYILAKRKRQGFLLVTIPAIAILSSLAMFAFSFVAHGVSVRSRVRSVTWIDQESQSAVSLARIAWFAGFAPSDGLVFSTSTAFVPIWHANGGFSNGSVDWTESQNLAAGFLRSRTRTQALTIGVRDERGRLTVTPNSDSENTAAMLNVTSGLEWPLEALIVWDDGGNAFATDAVEPGQAVTLTRFSHHDGADFRKLIRQSSPEIPIELTSPSNELFDITPVRRSGDGYSVSHGQLERAISEVANKLQPQDVSLARHYVAIAAEPPGIEFGTEVTIVDGWHLVIGRY